LWQILPINNNIQLLPSYEVNIESCQPERSCFFPKALARGLTTWCSPHKKTITVLLYQNYSKMFKTWMFFFVFFFVEDNKIISGFRKCNWWTRLKKKGFSTHFQLSWVVDQATTYCLPLHYICLGCPPGCFLRHQIFRKKYVRYNISWYCLWFV